MYRELIRRIAKLERHQGASFVTRMRAAERSLGLAPDTLGRLARGHEAELNRELRDGGITIQGFQLLYRLAEASHHADTTIENAPVAPRQRKGRGRLESVRKNLHAQEDEP